MVRITVGIKGMTCGNIQLVFDTGGGMVQCF